MKRILVFFSIIVLAFGLFFSTSAATENPYPSSQDTNDDGLRCIPCTWYAWQQAYENTGVALPNWGNAKNWYNRAASAGYAVGTEARPRSIAVWSKGTYGHVSYVVSVSGNTMVVNEGGQEWNNTVYNGNGIWNNHKMTSVVGEYGPGDKKLVGFIYLSEPVKAPDPTVNPGYNGVSDEIIDTNAILYGTVTKPSSYKTEAFGIRVWRSSNTSNNGWTYMHVASKDWVGSSTVKIWFDLHEEMELTLTHATSYTYQLYAKINGIEYWSEEATFTTTGSHSYGSWKTSEKATCTTDGKQKRSCQCGHEESKSLPATGHNFSTWKITKPATCTAAGEQTRTCSSCNITEAQSIAATGHSFGAWKITKPATCTEAGEQAKTCSFCNAKQTQSIVATGHSFDEWVVVEEATHTQTGAQMRKCKNCELSETKELPNLPADGHTHNFGNWTQITAAGCTQAGQESRTCEICFESERRPLAALGHSFGEWFIEVEATENTEGTEIRICAACNISESRIIKKLFANDPAKEPTSAGISPSYTNDSTPITSTHESLNEIDQSADDSNLETMFVALIIISCVAVTVSAVLAVLLLKKKQK